MTLLQTIAYAGTFVFALTGAFKARTNKMDVFGACVLAFVTAYGGGTLRDLLIGVKPVNWINDNIALLLVLLGTGFTYLMKENVNRFKRTIFYTDTIGIGLFSIGGIETSLLQGLNSQYALIMGVISATFGGLLADILCGTAPNLLKRGELYATACAIGGSIYLLLKQSSINQSVSLWLCVCIITGVRVYSKRKRLMLPDI